MPYQAVWLNRSGYIASIGKITDEKSRTFGAMSLAWWDRHFDWNSYPCLVLTNDAGNHLCYLFAKTDRYHQYLVIHNIFTPLVHRRMGYAQELLTLRFDQAAVDHVKRFKLTVIANALDFYQSLGLIYWGINSVGDYYCDLPLPAMGLKTLKTMIDTSSEAGLLGANASAIYDKVKTNGTTLSALQKETHLNALVQLRTDYRFEMLIALQN